MNNSEVRARARKLLGDNIFSEKWLMLALVGLICGAVLSAASTIVPGIGGIIITGPVFFAFTGYFMRSYRGEQKVQFERLIDGFKTNVTRNLLLGLLQALFIFLWSLLLIVPGIIKFYSYSMSFYIANDHPEYTWQQCLEESTKMMMGKKLDLFMLHLSFIGWIIVSALTCGIGSFWVIPYMQTSTTIFYESIRPAAANQTFNTQSL